MVLDPIPPVRERNMLTTCAFCDELQGGHENDFVKRYAGRLNSRVWLSAAHFVAMPSLGQLAAGHSLVIPRRHALSLGHLDDSELFELGKVKKLVATALEDEFAKPIWFEHGCVDDSSGGCGVSHAHLHALPVNYDLKVPDKLARLFKGHRITGEGALRERISMGMPYLFYGARDAGAEYMFEVDCLPSQFLRRIIAEELGIDRWDWRAAGYEDSLVTAVRTLRSAQLGV